jgi:hypothetical protein
MGWRNTLNLIAVEFKISRLCAISEEEKLVAGNLPERQNYRMRTQYERGRSSKSLSNLGHVKAFVHKAGKKKWMPLIESRMSITGAIRDVLAQVSTIVEKIKVQQ